MNKLKPVTFVNTRYDKHRQNTTQQIMLLNALKITQDPKKLKQMIGVRSVAEVYRTLDKMALRKEYHAALVKSGIDFGFIVSGIKQECLTAEKSADRLNGYKILLRSMGMDSYGEEVPGSGGGWEEALKIASENNEKRLEGPKNDFVDVEYEVSQPKIPESVKKLRAEDVEDAKGLYD
jgi:hypothetical protein